MDPSDQPTSSATDQLSPEDDPSSGIVVFWRPGCGFCSRLLGELGLLDIPMTLVNIWEEPAAAAVVRSIANGSETVPTVVVGGLDGAALINPSGDEVVAAIAELLPDLLAI